MTIQVRWFFLAAALLAATCSPPPESSEEGSPGTSVTADDYERAERFLSAHTSELVYDTILAHYWQDDDQLVYRKRSSAGLEYVLVNPATQSKSALFDLNRLTAELSQHSEEELDAADLELTRIELDSTTQLLTFAHDGSEYRLDLNSYQLEALEESDSDEFLSPDGSKAAFIEDHNLWVKDTATDPGHASNFRRPGKLRLRHQQRRLDPSRWPGSIVVARFHKNCHFPT